MDKLEIIGMEVAMRCKMFLWQDHGHEIVYLPSLDLSGYGPSFTEALSMLELAVAEFCAWLVLLPQVELDAELHRLGWGAGDQIPMHAYAKIFVDKEGALQGFDLGPAKIMLVKELSFEKTF